MSTSGYPRSSKRKKETNNVSPSKSNKGSLKKRKTTAGGSSNLKPKSDKRSVYPNLKLNLLGPSLN